MGDGVVRKRVGLLLCFSLAVIGAVAGYHRADQIAIAALPPNAWAGDGVGVSIADVDGTVNGAGLGLLLGLVCCFLLWLFTRQCRRGVVEARPTSDVV